MLEARIEISGGRISREMQILWTKSVARFGFLSKLFWFNGDIPCMIRDETESCRDFFGGSQKRQKCLGFICETEALPDALSKLYEVPHWVLEHLQRAQLGGPWFRNQGLMKILQLLARHDQIHAPSHIREFRIMVMIFDELLLDRHRASRDSIDSESLQKLKTLYISGTIQRLETALEALRHERIAWSLTHASQPPSLDVFLQLPTIAGWIAHLEMSADKQDELISLQH